MSLTTWRIYYAHVEKEEGYFLVTTYSMFGRELENIKMITGAEVRRFLTRCKDIEPKFRSNWTF